MPDIRQLSNTGQQTGAEALDALLGAQDKQPEHTNLDTFIAERLAETRKQVARLEEEYPVNWPPELAPRERLHHLRIAQLLAQGIPHKYIAMQVGKPPGQIKALRDEPHIIELCTTFITELLAADKMSLRDFRPLAYEAVAELLQKRNPTIVKAFLESEGAIRSKALVEQNIQVVQHPVTADQMGAASGPPARPVYIESDVSDAEPPHDPALVIDAEATVVVNDHNAPSSTSDQSDQSD